MSLESTKDIALIFTTILSLLFLIGLCLYWRNLVRENKRIKAKIKHAEETQKRSLELKRKGLKPFKVAGRTIYAKNYKEAMASHQKEVRNT